MEIVECILLLILIITGVAAPLQKQPLLMVITYTTFGLVMSVLWMLLQAPDLAITEAAVGTGISTVLLLAALKKIHSMQGKEGKAHAGKQEKA